MDCFFFSSPAESTNRKHKTQRPIPQPHPPPKHPCRLPVLNPQSSACVSLARSASWRHTVHAPSQHKRHVTNTTKRCCADAIAGAGKGKLHTNEGGEVKRQTTPCAGIVPATHAGRQNDSLQEEAPGVVMPCSKGLQGHGHSQMSTRHVLLHTAARVLLGRCSSKRSRHASRLLLLRTHTHADYTQHLESR